MKHTKLMKHVQNLRATNRAREACIASIGSRLSSPATIPNIFLISMYV